MTMKLKFFYQVLFSLFLFGLVFFMRLKFEASSKHILEADLRGYKELIRVIEQRERDSFRERTSNSLISRLSWPGLESAQVSWTWLELLQGMHHESSYQGDFSWLFSKLDQIIRLTPDSELRFITGLTPYLFVIGSDQIGSTIVMNELIRRAPWSYHVWFWAGFHALENLNQSVLAGDLYLRAAQIPGAPDYLAALSLRLSKGEKFFSDPSNIQVLEKDLDPIVLEKLKRAKPDFFN